MRAVKLDFGEPHPDCERCPLAAGPGETGLASRKVASGHGPDPRRIVLVAGKPSDAEAFTAGVAGEGRYHKLAIEAARKWFPSDDIYFILATRCFAGRKQSGRPKDPPAKALKECHRWFRDDLRALKPDLIIPFDKHAIAATLKVPLNQTKITQRAGRAYPTEYGCSAVPIQSPAWALYDPISNGVIWDRAWQDAKEHLDGDDQFEEKPWRSLQTAAEIRDFYQNTLLPACEAGAVVAYDYETSNGIDLGDPENVLTMVGYYWGDEYAYVHPLQGHDAAKLHKRFLQFQCSKVAHNFLFEIEAAIRKLDCEPQGKLIDTKILAYLENENQPMSLAALVARYVPDMHGFKRQSEDEAEEGWENVTYATAAMRNAHDVIATYRLAYIISDMLRDDQRALYATVFQNAITTIARMKVRGWQVNRDLLQHKMEHWEWQAECVEDEIRAHPDVVAWCAAQKMDVMDFKITSRTDHLPRFVMALGVVPKDAHGKPIMQEAQPDLIKTGMKILKPFFEQYPVLELIEEYFKLLDLIGKFAKPVLYWSERSGRLHPGYNLGGKANVRDAAGTVTSRLSSKDPNVMNYPPEILPCIVSRFEGGKILQRDFSQLELRVMAQAGDDDVFKNEFLRGWEDPEYDCDPHQATADAAGCDRPSGKVLNFMIAYGGGISRIMEELGCDRKTAERLLALFWRAHPKLRVMFARWRMEASTKGVITGLFGQDLHTPDAKDADNKVRSHAFRRSGNFPIQNGGAIITLRVMWRIEWEMKARGLKSLLIAQLHDALYFDCYPGEEAEVDALAKDIMENDIPSLWKWWEVPLASDSKLGPNMAGSKMRVAA